MTTKKCPYCGAEISTEAIKCSSCKRWLDGTVSVMDSEPQEFIPTLLFAWFLGSFGIHRFYTGSYAIGTIQLLTFGGCGIWSLVDLILICFNKYKDGNGRYLKYYNKGMGVAVFVTVLACWLCMLIFIGVLLLAIAATATAGL